MLSVSLCQTIKTRHDGGAGHGDSAVTSSDHTREGGKHDPLLIFVYYRPAGNMTTVCLFIVIIY